MRSILQIVANVRFESFEIGWSKLVVERQLLQTVYISFLFPVFNDNFCLIEIDVRMVHHSLHACFV